MDDEEMLRKMAGRLLEELGYQVVGAGDGVEAIELFREAWESGEPFDAVILDLTIPGGMGGKSCIKELKEINPDVKAIVASGYSDDPVMSNFRDYGFSGAVPKPYEPQELGRILHEVLADGKEQYNADGSIQRTPYINGTPHGLRKIEGRHVSSQTD